MHFNTSLKVAVISLFSQAVLGNPLALGHSAAQARAAVRVTRDDAFSKSGLDYHVWAKRMMDEGKMYDPQTGPIKLGGVGEERRVVVRDAKGGLSLVQKRALTLSLDNIRCYALGLGPDKEADYNVAKDKYCNLLQQEHDAKIEGITMIVKFLACEDENCDLFVNLNSLMLHKFIDRPWVDRNCGPLFRQLWTKCKGDGATGRLVIHKTEGSETELCGTPVCTPNGVVAVDLGVFETLYLPHDDGQQCPADTAQKICKVVLF